MIKVLQIGLSANPGGIENCIMNYYRSINKEHFSFDFVDQYGDGLAYADEIAKLGGKIHTLPNYKKRPISAMYLLRQILKQYQYDIIHVNLLSAANLIPIITAYFMSNRPIIIAHAHSANIPSNKLRKLLNYINIKILRKMFIEKWACSITAGRWMWDKVFDSQNVLPNAIAVSRFQFSQDNRKYFRAKHGFLDTDRVIGFVGYLCEAKNVLFLPEILHELKKYASPYKLLMVGEGKLKSELISKVKYLKLENDIVFTGTYRDIAALYSEMDLFVLPSIFEGLPLVGIEAQACGLPCIVSTAVSQELNITNTVKYLPIDQGADIWAESIHEMLQQEKHQSANFPSEYDIQYAAMHLEKRYSNLLKAKKNY